MNILFMCVANSARSQMAEGLARKLFGPAAKIESAGSQPGKLNPFAVKAMAEIDVDISRHYSKSIDRLPPSFLAGLDYVITLCAEEVCPRVVSRGERIHFSLSDPAAVDGSSEETFAAFRSVRDELNVWLKQFAQHFGIKLAEQEK